MCLPINQKQGKVILIAYADGIGTIVGNKKKINQSFSRLIAFELTKNSKVV